MTTFYIVKTVTVRENVLKIIIIEMEILFWDMVAELKKKKKIFIKFRNKVCFSNCGWESQKLL